MEAPVLSKNQKNKTLNKKKTINKSIRSVLSKPTNLNWPLIADEQNSELKLKLKELITYKKCTKIEWNVIKAIPKDIRNKTRQMLLKERNKLNPQPEYLDCLICGVNAITRALEKNHLSCVLMTADVNPTEIAKHIWHACYINFIPFIVAPELRLTIKECLGFGALCIGLQCITEDNPLQSLLKMVQKFDAQFTERDYSVIDTITISDSEINTESKTEKQPDDNESTIEIEDNIYLYRATKERVFKPVISENSNVTSEIEWNYDFLPFNDENNATNDTANDTTNDTANDTLTIPINNSNLIRVDISSDDNSDKTIINEDDVLNCSTDTEFSSIDSLVEDAEQIDAVANDNLSTNEPSSNVSQDIETSSEESSVCCISADNSEKNTENSECVKATDLNKVSASIPSDLIPIQSTSKVKSSSSNKVPITLSSLSKDMTSEPSTSTDIPQKIRKRNKNGSRRKSYTSLVEIITPKKTLSGVNKKKKRNKQNPGILNRLISEIQPINLDESLVATPLKLRNVKQKNISTLDLEITVANPDLHERKITQINNNDPNLLITFANNSDNVVNSDKISIVECNTDSVKTKRKVSISPNVNKLKRKNDKEFKYIPMKLKRLQPNRNRKGKKK